MSKQTVVTVYEVVERKAVTEGDPRFFRFTTMNGVPPIFTSNGDLLAEFPHTKKISYIDTPVQRFRHVDDFGRHSETLVAITPKAMEIFDAAFSEERRSALASLQGERQARANTLARINEFTGLPLFKRIWRAIRKAI